MAIRVSRQNADALVREFGNLRVSRQHVEALVLIPPPPPDLRISRQTIEVLVDGPIVLPVTARVSRQNVAILCEETPEVRISRQGVEVLLKETPNIWVSRQNVEVLREVVIYWAEATSVLSLEQATTVFTNQLRIRYYGTIHEAETYFANRLHEQAWTKSRAVDRKKALWASSLIIDALNYKGDKHPVYEILQANSEAAAETLRAADDSQVLEFPRDADTEVPEEIRVASYEIAHSLLDGKDPELELETLGIISQGTHGVTTSYSRNQIPIEHIINGVPSPQAWRLLIPYLREDDAIVLSRVS